MNYKLDTGQKKNEVSSLGVLRRIWRLIRDEKRSVLIACIAIVVNAGLTLLGPYIIGHAITAYIIPHQYRGVVFSALLLLGIYLAALAANYLQVKTMGGVGQRVLFRIRNDVFKKLQDLPIAFFSQNKTGDLISRINNDTDKLNQFFSQALMQFIGNIFLVIGSAVFLLVINVRLGAAALTPALGLLLLTSILSGWIKARNVRSLQSTGAMSAEVEESLRNFKVVAAFDRRDYFRKKFDEANEKNYTVAVRAGISNTVLTPIYDFASNAAQLIFLIYGISLIATGHLTIGFFISFLAYINRFYDPLRQMAALWATFQTALAGWDRISEILEMKSDLPVLASSTATPSPNSSVLSFNSVTFGYPERDHVLSDVSFTLEEGKTYALVGPTGGGKTTTASLMARLYDPIQGTVFLKGKDIRTYTPEERAETIGFILQEPFLFSGTVRENIVYGSTQFAGRSSEELLAEFAKQNLVALLERFPQGLDTEVRPETMSLGQKQLIAFMRALLRRPKLLILDEATANIDTVTETLLEEILEKLPKETIRVVIAHRLNTIADADEIFFVNGGTLTRAGSLEHAIEMLLHGKRTI